MNATETNKALIRNFIATLDRQDWDAILRVVDPACRSHVGGQDGGRDEWVAMGKMFYAAFPDGRHEIEGVLAEGDQVILRAAFQGTHRGAFHGVPPSGRSVSVRLMLGYRSAGERVVEHWGQFDALGLMQQIGALPAAPAA